MKLAFTSRSPGPSRFRIKFLVLALFAACCSLPSALSQEKIKSPGMHIPLFVLRRTELTDESLKYIERSVSTIPLPIQDTIAGAGIIMLLTPRYVDAEPDHSGEKAFRGGGGTENIAGQFTTNKKRVLLMERASGSLEAPTPVHGSLVSTNRHELGHAYDFALGNFSNTPEFTEAHQGDVRSLTNSQTIHYQYAITGGTLASEANEPTDSGRCECFAMLFAELVSPADSRKNDLLSAFPRVVAVMQRMEPSLKKVPQASDGMTMSERGDSIEKPYSQATQRASDRVVAKTASTNVLSVSSAGAKNPDLFSAHQLAARSDFKGAVQKLNDVLKKDPHLLDALLLRANCFIWLKQYDQAIADLDSYLKVQPNSAEALHLRGVAWAWLGRTDKQRADENRANELKAKS